MAKNQYYTKTNASNDTIDIYAKPVIDIEIIRRPEHGYPDYFDPEKLHLKLWGPNVDTSVVNALRRTVMSSIPIYTFHRSNIHVELEKTSNMYNNDMIYNIIETLPIFDVPNYFDLENPEMFLTTDLLRSLYGTFIQKVFHNEEEDTQTDIEAHRDASKSLFKVEISITFKNKDPDYRYVTTHDLTLKIQGKNSENYKRRPPITLFVLKASEEISFRAEANLGISKLNAIYDATTNAYLKEISPTEFELWYSTLGQLHQNIIFNKACTILIGKLTNLRSFIKKEFTEREDKTQLIEINLYGEDHTVGNLLSTILKKCVFVETAGYDTPHPSSDHILVSYKLKSSVQDTTTGPIKVLTDCIKYLIDVFELIREKHSAISETRDSSKREKSSRRGGSDTTGMEVHSHNVTKVHSDDPKSRKKKKSGNRRTRSAEEPKIKTKKRINARTKSKDFDDEDFDEEFDDEE